MKTTLNKIREHSPCANGWAKLLHTLGKTKADDEEVSIIQILDSNGLLDAIWCLRAVQGHDRKIRLFAVWCARQVEHLSTDPGVKACNDVSERFANGNASKEELAAAAIAANSADVSFWAAGVAGGADAAKAAYLAAGAAAESVARATYRTAIATDVAKAAAMVAAMVAADVAADAARAAQETELRRICEQDTE